MDLLRVRWNVVVHSRAAEGARDFVHGAGRGHSADHPHARRRRPARSVERHAQAVGVEWRRLAGADERVDCDEAVDVALAADGCAMDIRVAGRPDTHRVPLRLAPGSTRLHLGSDPRPCGRLGVPGRHELVERERDAGPGRGPRAALVRDGATVRVIEGIVIRADRVPARCERQSAATLSDASRCSAAEARAHELNGRGGLDRFRDRGRGRGGHDECGGDDDGERHFHGIPPHTRGPESLARIESGP